MENRENLVTAENYSIKICLECLSGLCVSFSDSDFNFIKSSLYSLEDTQLAKENFFKFWLEGPTKYENFGEMYLRLYGALNMFWLQHDAIITIYSKMLSGNFKEIAKKFKETKLIKLRNIAGAHTTSYKNHKTSRKKAFIICRHSMKEGKINTLDDIDMATTYDLKECIEEFECVFSKYLINLATLLTKKLKEDSPKKYSKWYELARKTKLLAEGEIRFDFDRPDLVIEFV